MNYLWDTNILVYYIRNANKYHEWNNQYRFFDDGNQVFLSIVNIGEIESLAYQLDWGAVRRQRLQDIVSQIRLLGIYEEIIHTYAEIDAYSQGKLRHRPLYMSARSMGKNDIWLAATAHIGQFRFVTTDNDFNHLDSVYIDLLKVS
jgi:predicted nucleic acid-binding protein